MLFFVYRDCFKYISGGSWRYHSISWWTRFEWWSCWDFLPWILGYSVCQWLGHAGCHCCLPSTGIQYIWGSSICSIWYRQRTKLDELSAVHWIWDQPYSVQALSWIWFLHNTCRCHMFRWAHVNRHIPASNSEWIILWYSTDDCNNNAYFYLYM